MKPIIHALHFQEKLETQARTARASVQSSRFQVQGLVLQILALNFERLNLEPYKAKNDGSRLAVVFLA